MVERSGVVEVVVEDERLSAWWVGR